MGYSISLFSPLCSCYNEPKGPPLYMNECTCLPPSSHNLILFIPHYIVLLSYLTLSPSLPFSPLQHIYTHSHPLHGFQPLHHLLQHPFYILVRVLGILGYHRPDIPIPWLGLHTSYNHFFLLCLKMRKRCESSCKVHPLPLPPPPTSFSFPLQSGLISLMWFTYLIPICLFKFTPPSPRIPQEGLQADSPSKP